MQAQGSGARIFVRSTCEGVFQTHESDHSGLVVDSPMHCGGNFYAMIFLLCGKIPRQRSGTIPRQVQGTRRPMVVPDGENRRLSLDFVSYAITDGRRFRIRAVVDDHTCENLVLIAGTSLSGLRVTRELDRVISERGMPGTIVSDNGTEFTSMAVLRWVQDNGIDWPYNAPGKPTQNAFIESFNGKLRLSRQICFTNRLPGNGRMPQRNAL
jgi:transposase InsO family protein